MSKRPPLAVRIAPLQRVVGEPSPTRRSKPPWTSFASARRESAWHRKQKCAAMPQMPGKEPDGKRLSWYIFWDFFYLVALMASAARNPVSVEWPGASQCLTE